MPRRGRALRMLGLVMGGWVALRVISACLVVWPGTTAGAAPLIDPESTLAARRLERAIPIAQAHSGGTVPAAGAWTSAAALRSRAAALAALDADRLPHIGK